MKQLLSTIVLLLLLLSGCQQEMARQPSYRPLQPSSFFEDGRSARPLVEGTVPRGARFDSGQRALDAHDLSRVVGVLGHAATIRSGRPR